MGAARAKTRGPFFPPVAPPATGRAESGIFALANLAFPHLHGNE